MQSSMIPYQKGSFYGINMEGRVNWLIVVFMSIINIGKSKYIEGELKTTENWIFMTRFCFLSLHGQFAYDIEYPEVCNFYPDEF